MPTPDLIFSMSNSLAMAAWLALAVSPHGARWTPRVRLVAGRLVPLLFAVVYVGLFATHGMAGGGYDSLAAVQRLMAVPGLLTAGWLHYLAFDLFVGTWIAERAGTLGVPHVLVLPLLALTFMFGPAGLLAFAALRFVWQRRHPASALA
ncbi:ABA4-like family protein [Rhizobacter sp. Root1221]|uniref:ABA4-like family protein n=1 Tax=Rhizobacter sp. Root1221 TaxID=1736433 RepID=UPI0006FFEC15|nr:ABA4-like family protein [Rhizobacter sp. Root1221]KQV97615.1 hypothetical protein ASC87_23440 [Rhizobacter sp. Root1221]